MKIELSNKILKEEFNINAEKGLNNLVKAIIVDFKDQQFILKNQNFKTRRKYMDFSAAKKEAGLHPLQIVFSTLKSAQLTGERFIGADDQIHLFSSIME